MRRAPLFILCALLIAACSKSKKPQPAAAALDGGAAATAAPVPAPVGGGAVATGAQPAEAPEVVYEKMTKAMLAGDVDFVIAHTSDASWQQALAMADKRLKEIATQPESATKAAALLGVTPDELKAMSRGGFMKKSLLYQSRLPAQRARLEGATVKLLTKTAERAELELSRADGKKLKKVLVVEKGEWKIDTQQSDTSD